MRASKNSHYSARCAFRRAPYAFRSGDGQLCAAFGGAAEVLERYACDLTHLAKEFHPASTAILDDSTRPSLWGHLRETLSLLLNASLATAIFKLAAPPSRHASLFADLQELADRLALPHALVARASGTFYFALLPASNDAASLQLLAQAASAIFSLCAQENAAALPWCPTALKHKLNVWGFDFVAPTSSRASSSAASPTTRAVARPDLGLMRRLKSAFDPQNLFAPGRFLP